MKRPVFLTLIALILLISSAAAVRAEDNADAPKKPQRTLDCRTCKGTGKTEWKRNALPKMDQQENTEQFWICELCAKEESLNYGIYWEPCKKCEDPGAKQEYDDLVAQRKAFVNWSAEYDKKLGIPLPYITTKHFTIGWQIDKLPCSRETKFQYGLPTKPTYLTQHEAMHIYAMRAEDAYDAHQRAFNLGEDDETDKVEVFWFTNKEDKEVLIGNHRLYKGTRGVNWIQTTSAPAIWEFQKEDWKIDDQLKFTHVHLIGHCLHDKWSHVNPQFPITWTTVGYGHWIEYELYKNSVVHCFHETTPKHDDWGHYNWRYKIYKKVQMGEMPSFPDIIKRNHETFGYNDHAYCFAYVDFLLHYDQEKWLAFQKANRRHKKYEPALEEVYKWSPLMFEEMFKEWVLKYYPRTPAEDDKWVYDPDNPR